MKKSSLPEVVSLVLMLTAAIASPAQTLTTLTSFNGTTGKLPDAPVIQANDGNFYGTTESGGAHNHGTVFKITSGGTLTTLYSFAGSSDGQAPTAGLVQGSDGNFYGTTSIGGNGPGGTVFKITPSGTLTTLVTFDGSGGPEFPSTGLIQATDGNFYGTTPQGGSHFGNGTVYKITPGGTVTTLFSFACSGSSGCRPQASLVQGSDGNFYGTTSQGGSGSNNAGAIYKITPSGTVTTLYSFCSQTNCHDGDNSNGALIQGSDGTFYGTTVSAGAHGAGTVFKITPAGAFTSLYSFCPGGFPCADGQSPYGALVLTSDGNLFGTTYLGGAHNVGTIFQLSPEGTLFTLHGFTGLDGAGPQAGLVHANDGDFYGTATTGGANGDGSVFKLQLVSYTLTVNPPTGQGTVTSSDGFINCPGACSHAYVENSQVNLTANPAQGWNFQSWGGACSGSNPACTVTMSNDETVSATFEQSSYTLTVSISGQGTITSTDGFIHCPGTCSHSYLSFTQLTLNAAPSQGWNFAGWSGACTGTGPCNLTMLGNYGVSAYFVEPGHGLGFVPVTPCRLVDTRQGNNPIQGGTSRNFDIAQLGGCGIPSGEAAYSLNVTVVPHGRLGFLTVWPAGLAQPATSTLNSDGRIKAVATIVQAGASDSISVYASNTTDLILDIDGYFTTPSGQTLQFYPLTPCRVVDTRNPVGPLGGPALLARAERDFPVLSSSCDIPASARAYSMNFTVVPNPSGQFLTYLTVWPEGGMQPVVSTLNNPTATTVANAGLVPAGTSGGIAVYPSQTTDLIVDINGYFAPAGTGGLSLYPAPPCRVIDTRNGHGAFMGELTVNVEGSACAPPSTAEAYVFNATVVPTANLGFLTLWPDGQTRPTASTLNAPDGAITSNMAIVPTTNGSIDAYASQSTQMLLDILSYFAP
jgi:uncharacterized repeat protein (TIGR03803 family)